MKSDDQNITVQGGVPNTPTPPTLNTSLLSSNPQFRAFASSIDYGIMVGDTNSRIVDFNDAALEIFGYSEEELRGAPITKIMPKRFREGHDAGIQRYNRTKKSRAIGKTLRLYGLHKSGKEFPLEIALSSWTDIDGQQYFTASMRKYTKLENNLSTILISAAIMSFIMLVIIIYLVVRAF